MVATVGSISVDLSANTAKFTSDFNRAATTVDKQSKRMATAVGGIGKQMKATSGLLQGFVGGIAGGAAFAALGSFSGAIGKAREALSKFDDVLNSARATGLSAETFQALQFGAAQSDVELETLNKGLEIFAKNVGLAEEGTGSLYSGLLKLNPELLKSVLNADDQEERLKLVADAMAQAADATDRNALANVAFGKGGNDLIRILDGGAAAIDRFKEEAKALGVIVTDADLERWAEADKKLDTLSKLIDNNMNVALANLAPLLVSSAEGMLKFSKEVREGLDAVGDFIANPSWATFQKFMASPMGLQFNLEGTTSELFSETARSLETVQADIARVEWELVKLYDQAREGAPVQLDIKYAEAGLKKLQAELGSIQSAVAPAKLLDAYRQRAGLPPASAADKPAPATTGGKVKTGRKGSTTYQVASASGGTSEVTVHRGGGGGDDEDIVDAIHEQTEDQGKGWFEVAEKIRQQTAEENEGRRLAREAELQQAEAAREQAAQLHYEAIAEMRKGYSSLAGRTIDELNELRLANQYLGGIHDSLVGRQYTQQIKTPTDIIAGFAEGGPGFDEQFLGRFAPATTNNNDVTINYTPDPGETYATTQQRMRVMLETAQRAQARS